MTSDLARFGLGASVIGGSIALGAAFTPAWGVLAMATAFLLLLITLAWHSVQSLTGEADLTLDEALGLGAPTAEEERKRAVLRALKDLEYERSVGKISEEDYVALRARYRHEAKLLLRRLDDALAPSRARAEALLEKRLARLGEHARGPAHESAAGAGGAAAEPEAPHEPTPERQAAPEGDDTPDDDGSSRTCSACSTVNDGDARFCKQCAAPLTTTREEPA